MCDVFQVLLSTMIVRLAWVVLRLNIVLNTVVRVFEYCAGYCGKEHVASCRHRYSKLPPHRVARDVSKRIVCGLCLTIAVVW